MEFIIEINNQSIKSQNKYKNNNVDNISVAPAGRKRVMVIGSCVKSTKENSHDFIHCKNCNISDKNRMKCSIKQCPCNGQGLLIETDSMPGKTEIYVHQVPSQDKSVRVCLQRPKQALDRITKLSQKYGPTTAITMMATPLASQPVLPRMRQKREREEEERNKDISIHVKDDERKSKKQNRKIDDDYSYPVRDLGQEIHLAFMKLYGNTIGFVDDDKNELDLDFERFMNENNSN